MQIVNSLIPIFSVIGLGMLLRHRGFLSGESTRAFNRFAYYFGLPLLLFYKIANVETLAGSQNLVLVALLLTSALTALLSWWITGFLDVPANQRGTVIQASFRGNLAFLGWPLILFLIEPLAAADKEAVETALLIALAPTILFYNVGSVFALACYNSDSQNSFSWASVAKSMVENPLIWACAGGVLFQVLDLSLPTAVNRTCALIGNSAFPLALVGIGSQLISISGASHWKASLLPTATKCIICPLLGWGIGTLIGLSGVELLATLIMCATPTAVSSYILADQMKGDGDLAASTVVFCTAFSFPVLAILIWITG